jgi:opacity protein-like surface antigen
MKKNLICAVCAAAAMFISTVASSQMTYGGRLGLNLANVSGDYGDSEAPGMLTSFYVGGVLNYELSDKLSLAPEVNFSVKGARSNYESSITFFGVTTSTKVDVKSSMSYLEIPINVGFKFSDALSVKAGPYVGLLMGAKSTGTSESTVAGVTTTTDIDDDSKEGLAGTDFGINVGLAYAMESGFGVEARFSQGLSNIYDIDGMDDTFSNRVISVGVFYLLGN